VQVWSAGRVVADIDRIRACNAFDQARNVLADERKAFIGMRQRSVLCDERSRVRFRQERRCERIAGDIVERQMFSTSRRMAAPRQEADPKRLQGFD